MQLTHSHAEFFPLLEVGGNIDGTAIAHRSTHAEILLEIGIVAIDGIRGAVTFINLVRGTVNFILAMSLFRRSLSNPITGHVLATGVVHDIPFYQRFTGPAVNADVGIVDSGKITLDQLEIRLHVANFLVGLIAIERKTGTAQIVLGTGHLAAEGAIVVERSGTTVAAFVPKFVTNNLSTLFVETSTIEPL